MKFTKALKLSIIFLVFSLGGLVFAKAQGLTLPNVNLGFKSTDDPQEVVSAIKILVILTVLTLAPAI